MAGPPPRYGTKWKRVPTPSPAHENTLTAVHMVTPTDVWALRYPDTNELWILERSIAALGGPGGFVRSDDGFDGRSVRVPASELKAAVQKLSPEFHVAVETAAANIRAFASMQMPVAHMREMGPMTETLKWTSSMISPGIR